MSIVIKYLLLPGSIVKNHFIYLQNAVIVKLLDHKSALSCAIDQICKLVQKQEFSKSLIELGLLETTNYLEANIRIADHENNLDLDLTGVESLSVKTNDYYDYNNVKVF